MLKNLNIKDKDVTIFGGSVGGEVAIKILLNKQIFINKLILSSPGLGKSLAKTKKNDKRKIYYNKIVKFVGYNVNKFRQNVININIIHGDCDTIVPISQSQELVNLNSKNTKLITIKGMNHKPKNEKEFLERLGAISKFL